MRKVLVIADLQEPGQATRRGLEMADKLKAAAEVVAFVYAPLKQLKVSDDSRASIKKQLMAEREEEVQVTMNWWSKPGASQRVSFIPPAIGSSCENAHRRC